MGHLGGPGTAAPLQAQLDATDSADCLADAVRGGKRLLHAGIARAITEAGLDRVDAGAPVRPAACHTGRGRPEQQPAGDGRLASTARRTALLSCSAVIKNVHRKTKGAHFENIRRP